ncbi:MAG: ribonuclease HII [Halobacteria archaeon]
MIGVDEAGKGAVLGSMFVAAVEYRPGSVEDDVDGRLDDSKRLSSETRTDMEEVLREMSHYVLEVKTDEVDRYVEEGRMNHLVAESHAHVLEKVKTEPEKVSAVVDASDVSTERFEKRVTEKTGFDGDVTAEHDADSKYGCVMAASVLAKVERDRHIEEYGVGSGYPSDPRTRKYLENYVETNEELPKIARTSWSTSKQMLEKISQSSFDEF